MTDTLKFYRRIPKQWQIDNHLLDNRSHRHGLIRQGARGGSARYSASGTCSCGKCFGGRTYHSADVREAHRDHMEAEWNAEKHGALLIETWGEVEAGDFAPYGHDKMARVIRLEESGGQIRPFVIVDGEERELNRQWSNFSTYGAIRFS